MPDDDDEAFAAALAAEIHSVSGRLRRRLREEGGAADLSPSQIGVLIRLENGGPSTVTELAQLEGVRPQSMGATVAGLQAGGFIVGAADPGDGRRIILSLSPMAAEQFSANRAARKSWLFQILRERLDADEQRELAHGIALLAKAIEP